MVKTLKQWVLPPRPKPGRKTDGVHLVMAVPQALKTPTIVERLSSNIGVIEGENLALRGRLLLLISEYNHLKSMVLSGDYIDLAVASPATIASASASATVPVTASALKKRPFADVLAMVELINDMSDSYTVKPPADGDDDAFSQFITLENAGGPTSYIDELDDDEVSDHGSPSLRLLRTISPTLDFDLTLLLTRSTTQTLVATVEPPKRAFAGRKFFELPKFEEENAQYAFKFDAMMTAAPDDDFNPIDDFLQEKFMDNDLKYYVDHDQILDKW